MDTEVPGDHGGVRFPDVVNVKANGIYSLVRVLEREEGEKEGAKRQIVICLTCFLPPFARIVLSHRCRSSPLRLDRE